MLDGDIYTPEHSFATDTLPILYTSLNLASILVLFQYEAFNIPPWGILRFDGSNGSTRPVRDLGASCRRLRGDTR